MNIHLTVVRVLGAALLLTVVAIGVLATLERPIPDVLEVLATAEVTGLLGLLAPRPDLSVSQRRGEHAAD